jgi:hypothetical protein
MFILKSNTQMIIGVGFLVKPGLLVGILRHAII